ncbi:acid ceramidase-like [Paramacrobiotus metropolitanus]|uniref:acid ceramidase-like n=1 Tax=Paramacrobiotus metropolitanus TaxID=2943436 RepID=UPI00244629D8|nr:acid ceramidase-like [Paramacrobiotus metropolitanus]
MARKQLLLLFTAFCAVSAQFPPYVEDCRHGTYPPADAPYRPVNVPTYQINLDLPGEKRWTELATDKAQEMRDLIAVIKSLVNSFSGGLIIDIVDRDLPKLMSGLPDIAVAEMTGIAQASGVPLGEVYLYNLFYEFNALCTSIVSEDPSGEIYHARNMDFGLFMGWDVHNDTWLLTEKLRPLVVNVEFTKNNQTVFKGVNFVGYIGIITGMKPQKFSLTVNERYSLKGSGLAGILKWILGTHTGNWMGFLTRTVFETVDTFSDAKNILSTKQLIGPIYFILGGVESGEGAVITRAADKALDIWNLNITNNTWYILETNYDHWKKPLFIDDRRTPAMKCMNTMGRANATLPNIFDVLNTKPVLNKLTAYTTLMHVKTGQMETYLRYCSDPCWPW